MYMDLSNSIVGDAQIELTIHPIMPVTTEQDECMEWKHIKYKSMIQNGVSVESTSVKNNAESLNNLERFLDESIDPTKSEKWNKMDRTTKLNKLNLFTLKYKDDHNLSEEEYDILKNYLKDCLEKKKLARVKDVVYDSDKHMLVSIPGLHFNKMSKKFTIKNGDTKKSVIHNLGQKKTQKKPKKVDSDKDKGEAASAQSNLKI